MEHFNSFVRPLARSIAQFEEELKKENLQLCGETRQVKPRALHSVPLIITSLRNTRRASPVSALHRPPFRPSRHPSSPSAPGQMDPAACGRAECP